MRLTRSQGFILADEPGAGKTLQAAKALAECVRGPSLVVCTQLSQPFWKQVLNDVDPDTPVIRLGVAGRFKSPDDLELVKNAFKFPTKRIYVLLHHQSLRTCCTDLMRLGFWHCIVADEAHRFKNRKALQTIALKSINTMRAWALTGTPMEKLPSDMWSLLHWFDRKKFSSYWKFFNEFVECESIVMGYETQGNTVVQKTMPDTSRPKGPKNLAKLKELLAPYYLKRTKKDILPSLPPKSILDVPLEMTEEQQTLYRKVAKSFLIEREDSELMFIQSTMARYHKLKAVALDPLIDEFNVSSVKVEWIVNWASQSEEPFVIFTTRKAFASILAYSLNNVACIHGDIPFELREQEVEAFRTGGVRGLVGTYDVMSESLNLERASFAICADLHLSTTTMDQAYNRVHRLSSTKPVIIYRLKCLGTVDELATLQLEKKWTNIELVQEYLRHEQTLRLG